MIPAAFDYLRAASLEEALAALADPEAKVLAGGHSLVPVLKLRLARPSLLVDVTRLDLRGVLLAGAELHVGALTTYDALVEACAPHPVLAGLRECAASVGDLQVRNAGTVGGALAHADPACDLAAAVLAYGGTVRVRSAAGTREIAVEELITGPFSTVLGPAELLVEVVLAVPPAGSGSAYATIEDRASGYPLAGAAVVLRRDGAGLTASVGATGFLAAPRRLAEVEPVLAAAAGRPTVEAVEGALSGVDVHAADPAYRRRLAAVTIARASAQAADRLAG